MLLLLLDITLVYIFLMAYNGSMVDKMRILGFSVVIIPENGSYSAWTPDLDVASQGDTVEEAIANVREAIELHWECLSEEERKEIEKKRGQQLITTIQIQVSA